MLGWGHKLDVMYCRGERPRRRLDINIATTLKKLFLLAESYDIIVYYGVSTRVFGVVLLRPTGVGEIKFFRTSAALTEKSYIIQSFTGSEYGEM